MSVSRRKFLGLGSLIACGAAAGGRAVFAAEAKVLDAALPLSLNDRNALTFACSYSDRVRLIGASVLGRLGPGASHDLHLLAEVADRGRFLGALRGMKFGDVRAEGNTLTFAPADVDVTIENLVPDVFAARLAAMAKREGNVFAHDALAYDPATKELSDPFDAQTGGVKLLADTLTGPAALEAALRGTLDAARFGRPEHQDFAKWKAGVLGADAPKQDPQKLAKIFLQQLATLADHVPAATVEALLRSRLLAAAFQQARGAEVALAIGQFRKLRKNAGVEISDAVLWLAALLGREIKGGAATAWIMHGTHFQVLRSQAALAKARIVLKA